MELGSNWEKEQEHWVLLTDYVKLEKYDKAKEHLTWLLNENPKLPPSLYKFGFIIFENLIGDYDDSRTKKLLKNEEQKLTGLLRMNFPSEENGI